MAYIRVYNALGRGLNMPNTRWAYQPPSDALPVGNPVITIVDSDTFIQAQVYVSPRESFIISAQISHYSASEYILESYILLTPNGILQAEFYNINIIFSKSANFSAGTILTNYLSGPDTILGNDFYDLIRSGDGNDQIYGNGGDDIIDAGLGNDFIDGGAGNDLLDYSDAVAGVEVNLSTGRAIGGYGTDTFINIESIGGSSFSDTLIGNSADNGFVGNGGNDLIIGGAGNDTVAYFNGIQDYYISYDPASNNYTVADKIAGRDGSDVLSGIEALLFSDGILRPIASLVDTSAPVALTFTPADGATGVSATSNITLTFSEAVQRGTGNIEIRSGSATGAIVESFNAATSTQISISGSTLTIDPTNNLTNDTVYFVTFSSGAIKDLAGNAYAGTTSYDFRTAANTITGTSGGDTLTGTSAVDIIVGLGGKDRLTGGAGNDILDGGAGNDIATYSVARSGASVRFDAVARKLLVNAGVDGTDTLVNVEQLRFSDGLYSFQYGDGASFNDFNALNGWNNQSRLPRLLVDVNGDGRTDLLGFANFGTVVSLARADGTFEPSKLAIADYGAGVQGWLNNDTFPRILADLNGDGRADILGFANFGAIVSLANADGTFQNSQLAIGDFGARFGWNSQARFRRELADVNGDQKLDLIGFGNSAVIVALGNGDGTFQPTKNGIADFGFAQGWGSPDVTPRVLADVNGDGRADIVGFASTGTMVALAKTDGTFETTKVGIADFGSNAGWTSQTNNPRLFGDVNGDGRADIVAFAGAGVVVALAKADGTFQNSNLVLSAFGQSQGWGSQDATPRQLIDLNRDGILDIIGFGPAGTTIAYGNGDGTFTDPSLDLVNFGLAQGWVSNNTFHRQIGDINGDGYPDILAFGNSATFTAINHGAYSNVGSTSQTNSPQLLGDVNGDGRADIVAFAGAGVVVALAKADGTFQNSNLVLSAFGQSQGWGSQDATPRQLIDLNRDGILDIIGFGPAGTTIAYGNGDGTFTDPSLDLENFGIAQGWVNNDAFHYQIGDFSGDGYPDILAFGNSATFTAMNHGYYVM